MSTPTQANTREDHFYERLFTDDPNWSSSFPNFDEATRASEILPIVSLIVQQQIGQSGEHLRIIDVGCGRGWLTNILSIYGEAIGLEPVSQVVKSAEKAYPHVQFVVGNPMDYAHTDQFRQFDLAVCSEVIEHVPHESQADFLAAISSLVRPGGNIVLTTPRGELFALWKKVAEHPQPTEAWLTERQLDSLARRCGLLIRKRRRCLEMPLTGVKTPIVHRRPFRSLMSIFRYAPDESSRRTIYQVVWLQRPLAA